MSTTESAPGLVLRDTLPAAVLFDMDGLLINTEPLWFAVEAELLAEFGETWSADDHAALIGSSAPVVSVLLSGRTGGRASAAYVAEQMLARMSTKLRATPPLQPGARELIEEIDAAGIARALVSSSDRVLIDAALAGVAPLSFDTIVAGNEVRNHKPHPEPYLAAAALLGADPAACVALEDSPTGARSAVAAGCRVIAVPSLAPIEPGARVAVVSSLTRVDLAFVRSLFATR